MAKVDPNLDYENDAYRVFECLTNGGIAIIHMDIAYAILSASDAALQRVYEAKRRNFNKPSGILANMRTHLEAHVLTNDALKVVHCIVKNHDLPISVIAPFEKKHPLIKALTTFFVKNGTRNGTVNFLLNASPLRDKIAELSLENKVPILASSANISNRGTKYRVSDIEPSLKSISDIIIDYGPATYMAEGIVGKYNLSSTQIDFQNMRLIRRGIRFEEINKIFADEFNILLDPSP